MGPIKSPNADLADRVFRASHLSGELTLRSGAVSDEYFDKYRFEADPALLRDVAKALAVLLPPTADVVAGLELGGIPLATMVSQVTGLPAVFVRKEPKTYGTRQLAEGGKIRGRRLAVIEDVVTSGGQLLKSCAALVAQGAEISSVLCVIDREASGAQNLAEAGLELRSVFTLSELNEVR